MITWRSPSASPTRPSGVLLCSSDSTFGYAAPSPSPSRKAQPAQRQERTEPRHQREGQRCREQREGQHLPFAEAARQPRHREPDRERGDREAAEHQADLGSRDADRGAVHRHHEGLQVPRHRDQRGGDEHVAHVHDRQQFEHRPRLGGPRRRVARGQVCAVPVQERPIGQRQHGERGERGAVAGEVDQQPARHRADQAGDRCAEGHPREIGGASARFGTLTDEVDRRLLDQHRAGADQAGGHQKRRDVGHGIREQRRHHAARSQHRGAGNQRLQRPDRIEPAPGAHGDQHRHQCEQRHQHADGEGRGAVGERVQRADHPRRHEGRVRQHAEGDDREQRHRGRIDAVFRSGADARPPAPRRHRSRRRPPR